MSILFNLIIGTLTKEELLMRTVRTFVFVLLICVFTVAICAADGNRSGGRINWGSAKKTGKSRIKLKLYLDKSVYKIGDKSRISIVADTDCYFMLYSVDKKGKASLVVPSDFSPYNQLKKNKTFYIRDKTGNSLQQLGPAGKETMKAIAAKKSSDLNKYIDKVKKGTAIDTVPKPFGICSVTYEVK